MIKIGYTDQTYFGLHKYLAVLLNKNAAWVNERSTVGSKLTWHKTSKFQDTNCNVELRKKITKQHKS